MAKAVKRPLFRQDERVQVVLGPEGVVERRDPERVHLDLDFPIYLRRDATGREAVDAEQVEHDFVLRLLQGGTVTALSSPSRAYVLRLLQHHYAYHTSRTAQAHYVAGVQRILRAALSRAEYRLAHPTMLDFDYDLELEHLMEPCDLLRCGLAWAEQYAAALKVARMQPKGPSRKALVLAYRILAEAELLPALQGLTGKSLAHFIAEELASIGKKVSEGTVYRYLLATDPYDNNFINTEDNYSQAQEWIENRWPGLNTGRIRPLRHMQASAVE